MVLDTSAVIAILQREGNADRLVAVLEDAGARRISAASLVEASIWSGSSRTASPSHASPP